MCLQFRTFDDVLSKLAHMYNILVVRDFLGVYLTAKFMFDHVELLSDHMIIYVLSCETFV